MSYSQRPPKCPLCKEELTKEKDNNVMCSVCHKSPVHLKCFEKGAAAAASGGAAAATWVCEMCRILKMAPTRKGTPPPSPALEPPALMKDQLAALESSIAKAITTALAPRFDALDESVKTLDTSMQFLSQKYDDLLNEMVAQKNRNAELKKGLEKVIEQNNVKDRMINQLSARVNELEQSRNSSSVEIFGIQHSEGENLRDKLKLVATQIGAPQVADTVEDVYRLPPPPPRTVGGRTLPGRVVVRFKWQSIKNAWLAASRSYGQQWTRGSGRQRAGQGEAANTSSSSSPSADSLAAAASGAPQPSFANAAASRPPFGASPPIKVYEQLTAYNRRLLFMTRNAAREKNFRFVWVREGKIFVRHSEELGQVIRIRCEDDIRAKMGVDNVPIAHV